MIPATPEKEKALIDALRAGRPDAKKTLYELFYRYLAAVCARYLPDGDEVDDLVQDVFIKIFDRFGSFEHRGTGSLQAWCRRVAVNEALQLLRARKKMNTVPLEAVGDLPEPDDSPGVATIPEAELLAMVRRLPDRYRTVFNLYVFEKMSHREIAGMLHIRENSSSVNLHRAKQLLTRWIGDYQKRRES